MWKSEVNKRGEYKKGSGKILKSEDIKKMMNKIIQLVPVVENNNSFFKHWQVCNYIAQRNTP